MARIATAWLVAWMVLLGGCLDDGEFGLGGQGDDDDDDDATSGDDDDMWDDDSSWDDVFPGEWEYYTVEISTFNATGGTSGGDANAYVYQSYFDEWGDLLCGISYRMRSTFTYGTNQDDQLFEYVDEVIRFVEGEVEYMTCPEQWAVDPDDAIVEWEWLIHPMTFVSCESLVSGSDVAEMYVGEDIIWGTSGDDTFQFYCDNVGPAAAFFHETGPAEGVWLIPGVEGDLDDYGEFSYFVPEDNSNVEVWMFNGFAAAEGWNEDELLEPDGHGPTPGLEGDYRLIPLWPWTVTF